MPRLKLLPCLDSAELAAAGRLQLQLSRERAVGLGFGALEAVREGCYRTEPGEPVDIRSQVQAALAARVSLPPEAALPVRCGTPCAETVVGVTNETTLGAARRLVEQHLRPLALNFANGGNPGGGFLHGALAQEEALCRSSALFATLDADPMDEAHRRGSGHESSDWAILSPDVPVFRADDGTALGAPWLLSILTCAAPLATVVGQPRSAELLRGRMRRVLEIARAYGYAALVLGAWGCGAFGNDPARAAADFRAWLEGEFLGVFEQVVFAVTDWSPERRFLGPFRDTFRPRTGS